MAGILDETGNFTIEKLKNMKQILFLLAFVMVSTAVMAQSTTKVNGAVITFKKKTHDFGDITEGDRVEHTYKFTNTGNEPLILTDVQVTCGCTVPKWPRNPIMPGQEGEILVAFNSASKFGKQNKVITIVSNATNADGSQISFTTNVLQKGSSPQ